jgi:hypothetical protein
MYDKQNNNTNDQEDDFDEPSEQDVSETLRKESMTRRKRPSKKNPTNQTSN